MSISILVDIVLRDGLSPRGSSLELDVVNVDSSIDDVCREEEGEETGQSG